MEKSLYERLGSIYSIAAVVEHFAEALAKDLIAGLLNHFDVPEKEKNEVMEAFAAHKEEVISETIK